MKKFFLLAFLLTVSACKSEQVIVPAVVHNVNTTQEIVVEKAHLPIIGEVEPIYFLPMKSPFYARIDTGATTSALDCQNVEYFERDGEKWVAFKLKNRKSGEEHIFEKKIERTFRVRRVGEDESRKAVKMDVKMGGETFSAVFSIADRSGFDYQGLIGRNILTGRFIVDTSTSYTLN
ncbi:MAG: ATP-dependent zinc protease [Alphaproteobacteria bacterium]|nr:ATP-dependent zinc protease [Alphaproteobacteria bacterium]MBP3687396.1 ATP-dependent zinc protease [Alphaproteobacteria bacterium]